MIFRQLIGEEVVAGIQVLEGNFYRLAATQNPAAYARIFKAIDVRLDKIQHDLSVLQHGGKVWRVLALNVEGRDETVREMEFRADASSTPPLEVLEIAPLLQQTHTYADELEDLLARRWLTLENEDSKAIFAVEEDIAIFLKRVPAYFERLSENANRLLVVGAERQKEIEKDLAATERNVKTLEALLVGAIILIALVAGWLATRRIALANTQLSAAFEEIARRNELNTTMLDTLSDSVYATDVNGCLIFMNSAAETTLGWKSADLVGRNVHEAIHHTRPDGTLLSGEDCPLFKVLAEGSALEGEEYFIAKDGRFIPVSFRSRPLLLDNKLAGSLVSFQDIGEQREREAQLRLQNAALDAAANMIVITNRDGIIEYVNPAFSRTTGYSIAEVTGRKTTIFTSSSQDKSFYESMWATVLAGQVWEGEIYSRRKDGSTYPEQMTITPIMDAGVVSHFVAIKRDISEEIATRTRLMLVETAIQNIDQAFLITSNELSEDGLKIEWVNEGFTQLTGYSLEEACHQRTAILRSDKTDLNGFRQLLEILGEGRSHAWEADYQRKDGTRIEVELYYAPVRDGHGTVTNFIGLMTDIGPRKAAEAALLEAHDKAVEASRLKSEFLSNMSHEIRTPMNGIIGMTDLLLDTTLSGEQREFAGMVRDSAASLLTIINDILDFSKIEAGKLDIEIISYSPLEIVEGAAEILAPLARAKGLSLMTFVDPLLPSTLSGDPTRIRQILINLISNAVKFTAEGCVTVRAERYATEAGPQVRFSVADTGIGMSEGVAAKLFQPFVQADGSTTRRFGGTGLGLAISRRLVELMGGKISVASEDGKGAEFRFDLPSIATTTAASRKSGTPLTPGQRIIVVDDHPADREIFAHYLTSWGMACETVADGETALEVLRQAAQAGKPFEVALIDYSMPGMNGLDLVRLIQADPSLQATRMIMITALERREIESDAKQAGALTVLAKPLRQAQLLAAITPALVLPTEFAAAAEAAAASAQDVAAPIPSGKGLILIAEDNPTNRKVAQAVLAKLGYTTHCVENGRAAVEAAQRMRYSAILMDCQMPVMDGFEATALIRKHERGGAQQVPIIAMTANAMQGDRERCLAAGMTDYVAKPIDTRRLAEALARWAASGESVETASPIAGASEIDAALQQLQVLFGDDAETIAELVETFRRSTATIAGKLHTALTGRSSASLYAIGHEAKGACGNLGFEALAGLAAEIETAAKKDDWPRLEALVGQFAASFTTLDAALELHFHQPDSKNQSPEPSNLN